MRNETIKAWTLVGFGVLAIGTLLKAFQVNGKLGIFLSVMGLIYIGIAFVLSVMHDRHMMKRMQAGESENE